MGLAGIKLHPGGLFNTRTLIGLTSSGYYVHQLFRTCIGHQINNPMPGKNTPTMANIIHLTASDKVLIQDLFGKDDKNN